MQSLLDTFSENNGNDLASTGNLLLILSAMQKKPSESRTDISNLYFQKASEYIRNNYAYPIQISDVAHYVGIDRSYLYRIFMEHENTSPKQYLLKHRLQMQPSFSAPPPALSQKQLSPAAFGTRPPSATTSAREPATPQRNSAKPTAEPSTPDQTPALRPLPAGQKMIAPNRSYNNRPKQFHNSKKRRKPSRRLCK